MRAHILRAVLLLALAGGVAGSTSCTSAVRQGDGSTYLIIDRLEGVEGQSGDAGTVLRSDVVAIVTEQIDGEEVRFPVIFEDLGTVTLRLALKDIGTPESPTAPTTNNLVTVNRYRVTFRRTDGRNTPGVDVPHPFEGAFTVTVGSEPTEASFTLVRIASKSEPPLRALRGGGGLFSISTIAEITFYGQDQTGHAVAVTGQLGVEFADWADEE